MKVFWLKKSKNEDISQLFRSNKLEKTISTVSLSLNPSFKAATILNPCDSRCICTIHDLHYMASDETTVWLFMDETDEQPENYYTAGILKVNSSELPALSKNNIEILEENHRVNDSLELTSHNYAILLPGGCLTIVSEKNISSAELTINWSIEEL